MKLKLYTATFIGKLNGAIGEAYWHTATIPATDEEDAKTKLYETHEHISNLKITERISENKT